MCSNALALLTLYSLFLNSDYTMKSSLLVALVSQVSAISQPSLQKRYPTGSFSLLAYGVASEGINVFYSDGITWAGVLMR